MLGRILNYASRSASRWKNRRRPLSQAPDIEDKTFVFIGGLHRSGTSILFRLLCEHPATSGFRNTGVPEDEGQHLQSVIKAAYEYGGAGEFAIHPEAHLTETSALISQHNRDKILCQWGAYYDLRKPVLLEKSPPNLIRSRFLRQMFPHSKFIFIVRHPVAVSLATEKWSKRSIVERLLHWHAAYSIMLDDIDDANDCLVLRYEDLVAAPAAHLDRICDLIGIDRFAAAESVVDHNENYFSQWRLRYGSQLDELEAAMPRDSDLLEHFAYSLRAPFVGEPGGGG